jgi:hypothetical protein
MFLNQSAEYLAPQDDVVGGMVGADFRADSDK